MDKAESTQHQKARTVNFADADNFYQLQEGVTQTDMVDHLNARLAQLCAMLHMTYGAGREHFDLWGSEVKDNYLWGVSMIAQECKEIAGHL
ncbi:MAG: hypothetical protein V4563_15435 [Pseudomonadota bacterium]